MIYSNKGNVSRKLKPRNQKLLQKHHKSQMQMQINIDTSPSKNSNRTNSPPGEVKVKELNK